MTTWEPWSWAFADPGLLTGGYGGFSEPPPARYAMLPSGPATRNGGATQSDPRKTAFARLAALAARPDGHRITPLFAADPDRATRFSASLDGLTIDFSKSAIDDTVLDALFGLAQVADLEDFRRRLFSGEAVNATEHHAAMHMALRAPVGSDLRARDEDATASR